MELSFCITCVNEIKVVVSCTNLLETFLVHIPPVPLGMHCTSVHCLLLYEWTQFVRHFSNGFLNFDYYWVVGQTLQICKWWFFGIMGMLHEIMGVQWLTSAASSMTYQLLLGAHESNCTLCQLLHIKQLIPISAHMSNFCWWMRPTKKCCTWTDFLFWPHWLTSTRPRSNLPPWKGIHKWPCTHCFSNARHPLLPQLHSHSPKLKQTLFCDLCVYVCVCRVDCIENVY